MGAARFNEAGALTPRKAASLAAAAAILGDASMRPGR